MNKIKVIVPFYNPGDFLETCVSSILTQKYDNYEVLFINDASTDNSQSFVPKKIPVSVNENNETVFENSHPILDITACKSINLWNSSERRTALRNIHYGIMEFAKDPDDIVVLLDGDDWLLNKHVLSYINEFYEKNPDCWMMYGSSQWTDGRMCCARPYSQADFDRGLRKSGFKVSHIRTFRAGLYHSIQKQDIGFSCMTDEKGEWYRMTYDVAMFLPMLEMAGMKHVFYNSKKLYVYNRDNPISDDKVSQSLQWQIHEEINKKKSFKQIESYK